MTEGVVPLFHFTVSGAEWNSGTQPLLGDASEFMVPMSVLAQPGVEAVYLGHVHKPQELYCGDVPVTYIGSAIRSDFGDEPNECRALYVEPGKPVESIALPAARFVTIAATGPMPDVSAAVVRVKGELPAGQESAALLAARREQALEAGAIRVAKPAVTFTRHTTIAHEHGFSVEAPAHETLARYFELAGGDYVERSDELLSMHSELAREGGS